MGELPADLDPAVRDRVRDHLIGLAAQFGPVALRNLGRKVLEVIDPDAAEDHERARLEAEERDAAAKTYLRTRCNGDGTTDIHARVADAIAARLVAYLESFSSPRRDHLTDEPDVGPAEPAEQEARPHSGPQQPGQPGAPEDRRPYAQRLGHAFGSFLEAVDPVRLPIHGGDATTVIVTITLEHLRAELAGIGIIGDQPITAGEARRLACTAGLIPMVLGGDSEILDLGRSRRTYQPSQRKALAIRDVTCRGEGCDIPAAWCEAHHLKPWGHGGHTNLTDGVLLCSFHHHKAHDHHYDMRRMLDGSYRFRRRV